MYDREGAWIIVTMAVADKIHMKTNSQRSIPT